MNDTLHALTQAELLALALEASRRDDTGHAMAYLKEAASRNDATGEALFLLGSEYAQVGLVTEALAQMTRAVTVAPGLAIARFQLGMLHLTSGAPEAALSVWQALAELDDAHPQGRYLKPFHRGLQHLVADRFDACLAELASGIAANTENEALNADMRKVIDAINHLPGRSSTGADVGAGVGQPTVAPVAAPAAPQPPEPLAPEARPVAPADELTPTPAPASAPEPEALDEQLEPSHLFISAYKHRGKPH